MRTNKLISLISCGYFESKIPMIYLTDIKANVMYIKRKPHWTLVFGSFFTTTPWINEGKNLNEPSFFYSSYKMQLWKQEPWGSAFIFVSHGEEIFFDPEYFKFFGCMLASVFIPGIFSISKVCVFALSLKDLSLIQEWTNTRNTVLI